MSRRTRDYAIAAGVTALQVAGAFGAGRHEHHHHRATTWLTVLLLVAGGASLSERGRHPRTVLTVVFACALAYSTIGYAIGPQWPMLVIAFLTVVAHGHRREAWATVVAGWALFLWLPAASDAEDPPSLGAALGLAAWLLLLIAGGELIRSRGERIAQERRRRREEERRVAGEERLRIARELHDVLAHNISLISVQAGVALHLMDERPEQARTALEAIRQASGETLREMRSVLDVLRDGRAPRTPTAGLSQLDDVVSRSAAAGLAVDVRVEGSPRPLPAGVDLAAFRIVQEALTNVARHAGSATARVRLAYRDDELTVEVDDDGRGEGDVVEGNGTRGMRERAAALGGELRVGRRPDGGYRVMARLPA